MAPTWAGPGLFRFTQAIRNKFRELGGVTLQRSNAAITNGVHIFVLPRLPPSEIENGYLILKPS